MNNNSISEVENLYNSSRLNNLKKKYSLLLNVQILWDQISQNVINFIRNKFFRFSCNAKFHVVSGGVCQSITVFYFPAAENRR